MRPALAFVSRATKEAARRSFSTGVVRITMPEGMSEEYFDRVSRHYEKFVHPAVLLKPLTVAEAEKGAEELRSLVEKDVVLFKAFEEAAKRDAAVTMVDGITVVALDPAEIPRTPAAAEDPSYIHKIRACEIALYAYSRLLGVKPYHHGAAPRLVAGVYATEADKDNTHSYRSATKLKWHNDGWDFGEAVNYVMLLGIRGKKEIATEFVTFRAIVDFFIKSGKGDFLKVLSEQQFIDDGEFTPITILDLEKKRINYEEGGPFTASHSIDNRKLAQALQFLDEALDSGKIPTFRVSIEGGRLVAIPNAASLHRKISDPGTTAADAIGQRLLLRGIGDKPQGRD